MLSQRQSAHLGLCAAAILVVSCLGVLVAGAGDRNAANTDQQKSVQAAPQPQHVSTAGLSAALSARER